MRKAIVRLNGGLGNQLFQYHLATFLWLKSWDVSVYGAASAIAHDQVGIRALKLPLPLVGTRGLAKLPLGARKAKAALQVGAYRLTRKPLDDDGVRRFLNLEVEELPARSFFDGDFQFAQMVETVRSSCLELQRPELVSPSPWYVRAADMVARTQPWALHVRRGDFTARNGILGLAYYALAIEKLGISASSPGLLFSDSPEEALGFLRPLGLKLTSISPSPSSPAAESLMLMASSSRLVCSNSTFSWWAAKWSEGVSVMPEKFFPEGVFVDSEIRAQELSLPDAIRIPAMWAKEVWP